MAKVTVQLAGVLFFIGLVYPSEAKAAQTGYYKELVKKAKSEGEVEFWAPQRKDAATKTLKVFSKKFGIRTKYRRWTGVGRQQRTLLELRVGRTVSADVMAPGRDNHRQFLEAGLFQKPPFEYSQVWPEIDKRQYLSDGWALSTSGNSRAIAYNSTLVPPELVPKTWDDCTRSEFKGNVVLDSRHKLYALHWNRRDWFLDWVKKMVANDVILIRGQTDVLQLVSAGAHALFCSAQPYVAQRLIAKGAENLKIAVPGELLIEAATISYIRKGTPNPHAAQLLVGWLVSMEGQREVDKHSYHGFPWVEGTFNSKLAKGNKVLLCGPECVANAGEMAREYTKALGLPVTK